MLKVGIVGLPNSGKSTLFNALLQRQIADVAEYPFTTIEPNVGVVQAPDPRLEAISKATGIEKIVPAAIEFIDIAGLVKGAHEGEGLGNQFLGHIREVDALLHLVRAFHNPNVVHHEGSPNPERDVKIVEEELQLAGIEKPTIYVVNVDEKDLADPKTSIVGAVKISAKLESELSELSQDEAREYLKELGVSKSGLEKVITLCYSLLDLITFFTVVGGKQAQAWPLRAGETALSASGIVHTDMQKGFIKVEVVDWEKLVETTSWKKAMEKGWVRLEGRDYKIADGDVIEFKFST
ncbi:MAG TPA: redox-regulated ATPase YchF [Candidatus Nanoarchaeia archaeon]